MATSTLTVMSVHVRTWMLARNLREVSGALRAVGARVHDVAMTWVSGAVFDAGLREAYAQVLIGPETSVGLSSEDLARLESWLNARTADDTLSSAGSSR